MNFRRIIKLLLPSFLLRVIRDTSARILYNYIVPRQHKKAIHKLSHKETPIKCVFLALFDSVWKYDGVYRLLQNDPRFEPIILVCPIVNYGYDNMINKMEDCYSFMKNKDYNVILSYDRITHRYVDLRADLNPDIIFYTNPYKGLIDDRYYVDRFADILSVYVPYCAQEGLPTPMSYNLDSHNRFWRCYTISDYHKEYSKSLAVNHGKNVKVTGFPQIELFLKNSKASSDLCWKQKESSKKRIIWAPHHTFEAVGSVDYSTFLKYSHFMIAMAEKYKDQVQWVFKPHPLLRNKLDILWGKDRTETYYSKWEKMENTSYIKGDYVDLFLTSDAMIHDSGSFILEYLYVNKPVLRPLNNIPLNKLYNQFALDCLHNYYFADTEEEIEQFIKMVIVGEDPQKESRTRFLREYLKVDTELTPSHIIVEDIWDSIINCKTFVD